MGWREYAKELQEAGHNRHDRHNSPEETPIVPTVPSVPAAVVRPDIVVRSWWAALGKVDPRQPLGGFTMGRWQMLYDSSLWWLQGFGTQEANDGWTTSDVFGLWPDKPGWGGLVDRIGESRTLVMTADRACWRSWGQAEQFNRGSYPELRAWWVSD